MPERHHSKVLIIGAGPAGYTAAIYAARANLKPILVTGLQPGGQLTITTDVENYPGFAEVIQGPWLMEQMHAQAEHVGTRMILDMVAALDLGRRPFVATGDSGDGGAGELAWHPGRGRVPRLWRLGLRHLRRVLLPRQGRPRHRRRQYRSRGGHLSDKPRPSGDARSPARHAARRENPAGPALPQPEDRGGVGHARR